MQGWTQPRPAGQRVRLFHALFRSLGDWDATWYRWIAEHGYDPSIGHGNTAAFFPLYPLAWRPLTWLPGPGDAVGQPAVVRAAGGGAVPALPDDAGPLRRGDGAAHRALPGDLPAGVRVLAALRREPVPAAGAGRVRAHLVRALVGGLRCRPGACSRGRSASRCSRRSHGGSGARARGGRCATCRCFCCRRRAGVLRLPVVADGRRRWRRAHAQERGWGRGVSVLPIVFGQATWDAVSGGHLRFLVHAAFTLLWCWLFYWAWRHAAAGRVPDLRRRC